MDVGEQHGDSLKRKPSGFPPFPFWSRRVCMDKKRLSGFPPFPLGSRRVCVEKEAFCFSTVPFLVSLNMYGKRGLLFFHRSFFGLAFDLVPNRGKDARP